MKLLRSTKSKITSNENGENIPNLEITELVLIYCNIVNNSYRKIHESSIYLFLINLLVNY